MIVKTVENVYANNSTSFNECAKVNKVQENVMND
jgi:hypothetical protein